MSTLRTVEVVRVSDGDRALDEVHIDFPQGKDLPPTKPEPECSSQQAHPFTTCCEEARNFFHAQRFVRSLLPQLPSRHVAHRILAEPLTARATEHEDAMNRCADIVDRFRVQCLRLFLE